MLTEIGRTRLSMFRHDRRKWELVDGHANGDTVISAQRDTQTIQEQIEISAEGKA